MEYTTTLATNEPIAITIGNFDGVHRGHQLLMQTLRTTAHELGCRPAVVTFSPHTLLVVRPDIDFQCLTTLPEKLAFIKRYGHIDDSIVINFTPAVKAMSAQEFMDDLLAHFAIGGIVVGTNFSVGHDRMGDINFLQRYCREHALQLHIIPLEEMGQTRISSTRIRSLVSEGQVAEANELLGHPTMTGGIVVRGEQRGRLLGFPTANLVPQPHKLIPANGVYAAHIAVDTAIVGATAPETFASDNSDSPATSRVYNGVVNIGIRPTFGGQKRLVEAVLFDVELDLYDRLIAIDFIARLRGEKRFAGIEALKAQIASDIQEARNILGR